MKVVITGAAGFIGSRVAEVLAAEGLEVLGIDNINSYYDSRLKIMRLNRSGFDVATPIYSASGFLLDYEFKTLQENKIISSKKYDSLRFVKSELTSKEAEEIITAEKPDVILHLAAQPGVRHSITNAEECLEMNVMLFIRVLEICRKAGVQRLLYASSSSVYGNQHPHGFKETDVADSPLSVYAVSKRTNEMLASVYAEMYGIRMVGLRFFSVYGEWGRPDMAPMLFAGSLLHNRRITLFNGGLISRDFTYIEDVAESVRRIVVGGHGFGNTVKRHEIFNIGRSTPVQISDFVKCLEQKLDCRGDVCYLPMQPGEAAATLCDSSKLKICYGYSPGTNLEDGLGKFTEWIKEYKLPLDKYIFRGEGKLLNERGKEIVKEIGGRKSAI